MKKKVLLVGANGMLGKKITQAAPEEFNLISVDLPEFDIIDRQQIFSLVASEHPDTIINCAAFTQVDRCETEETLANAVNGTAVGTLAEAAGKNEATLIHISTDYVFDGEKNCPYQENDPTGPRSAYGRSKLTGEQAILASDLKKYFIVRTSWLYGPGGNNFVETIIRLAKEREELKVVSDQVGNPTYTGDLAEAVFSLLSLENTPCSTSLESFEPYGIYHFSDEGQCSWYDFAVEIIALARKYDEPINVRHIKPITTEEYPLPAKRPAYSVFSKKKYCRATGKIVPHWKESLALYFAERSRLIWY